MSGWATAEAAQEYRRRPEVKQKAATFTRNAIARRSAFLNWLKALPCADCKQAFPPECMDFDHVRGSKEYNLRDLRTMGTFEKIATEVQKCEVVCANCHRIRTKARIKGVM